MHNIEYVEFYITNVCNLSCNGCNRFNNYKFKGFQRWADYQEEYTRWSKELQFGSIGILGGEPLLNADFMLWLRGIRQLWPNTFIKVVTNGYYLNKVAGLYDNINSDRNTELWVGIHNKLHKKTILNNIEQFLVGPV